MVFGSPSCKYIHHAVCILNLVQCKSVCIIVICNTNTVLILKCICSALLCSARTVSNGRLGHCRIISRTHLRPLLPPAVGFKFPGSHSGATSSVGSHIMVYTTCGGSRGICCMCPDTPRLRGTVRYNVGVPPAHASAAGAGGLGYPGGRVPIDAWHPSSTLHLLNHPRTTR